MDSLTDALTMIYLGENLANGKIQNTLLVSSSVEHQPPFENDFSVCHAEMNAILNKNQAECSGSTIYTTLYPCNECAKLIIQSGIENVIYAQV